MRICRDNGFVLPTVYEGNYSPIARKPESVLFPLLRDYGMTFYAYSPLAGGFLAKSREAIVAKQCPKFDQDTGLVGLIYATLYNKVRSPLQVNYNLILSITLPSLHTWMLWMNGIELASRAASRRLNWHTDGWPSIARLTGPVGMP